jgi:hypothetical protein
LIKSNRHKRIWLISSFLVKDHLVNMIK